MIHQLLILIIFYIIINQLILSFSNNDSSNITHGTSPDMSHNATHDSIIQSDGETIPLDLFGEPYHVEPNKLIVWIFNNQNPWTQIMYKYGDRNPLKFNIKTKIPSLNDYEEWKKVIPDLDFNATTGELVIPAKDEASALAITNLIVSTFQGTLSMSSIFKNNLIKVSINKARKHVMVTNKLRDQINNMIHGKKLISKNENKIDYEEDLVRTNRNFESNIPEAFEGSELSYL